ncbi:tetratricopeptide repeat protein [Mesobacillus maritimus]|uniref:tetratricopeptide repeat protein n=1 Tax=Mesobacillus maritimus TaxID=1643336 RepID=UPI00203CF062|nr:tetratricopeptide repeat protein [Mesobacillus maritimus]MCM3585136.1 tetratricopeptide repeat protein [Mesobacillus maritimus]MCM3668027.1 tetratricopeptide repeat protein [Mesobacillus maritimus]
MGEDSKAIKQKGQLLSFVPTGEYYFTKGVKAYHRRDLQRAHKYFSRAMQLEPGEPMIVCQLAIVATELGDYQQSIGLLKTILEELDEEMVECHYFLANNYAHMGLFKDAYHHANLYLELNRDGEFIDDAEELLELIMMEADDIEDALFEEDSLIVKQEEARSLLEAGEFTKAIEIFEELVKDYPEYWSAYNNLALAYFYLGNPVKANEILQQVLEKSPGNLHALCNKLVFAYYQNQPTEVQELTKSLAKIQPLLMEQQFKLGATFSLVGEFELGYKWLNRLRKHGHEGDGAFYYWLAISSYHTGREQAAKAYWKKVLEFNPEKQGNEPWGTEEVTLNSQVTTIINRFQSDHPEERLFALFLTSVSDEKEKILATNKITEKLTSLEKTYLSYVQSGVLNPEMESVIGGHETALVLYDFHQPINHTEAGIYLVWFAVFEEAVKEGLNLKNKKAWAAAVEYVWEKLREGKITKNAVAQKYGLSVSTLNKYIELVSECLN